jgi:hypothetical protein
VHVVTSGEVHISRLSRIRGRFKYMISLFFQIEPIDRFAARGMQGMIVNHWEVLGILFSIETLPEM